MKITIILVWGHACFYFSWERHKYNLWFMSWLQLTVQRSWSVHQHVPLSLEWGWRGCGAISKHLIFLLNAWMDNCPHQHRKAKHRWPFHSVCTINNVYTASPTDKPTQSTETLALKHDMLNYAECLHWNQRKQEGYNILLNTVIRMIKWKY